MDKKNIAPLNWLINLCLYLVVFLTPLFFLPITLEKFELNKYFLFYFLVLLALLGFLGKAVIKKGFEIRRTPLDIPLLVLWFVYLIISLFSQDRYLSFFGDFNSLNLSFIGFSLMLFFYFLIVQQMLAAKQILYFFYILLFSGLLSTLYFILGAGSFLNWSNFNLPQFNLVSSSNIVFGFFVALIFILSLGYLSIKKRKIIPDIFTALVSIASILTLVMLGFSSVWIFVAIGLFLLAVFFIGHMENSRPFFNSLILFFLVVTLLFIFLGEPKFLTKNLPLEVSLSPGLSWTITYGTLTADARNFIFGTGPGTFIYDFSHYRPDSMNLNFAWNVRFNQPYSTIFDWITTYGILTTLVLMGVILLVLGFLITIWIRYVFRVKSQKRFFGEEIDENKEYQLPPLFFWLISCGWLLSLVSLFLVNLGVVQWIIFWSLLGLIVSSSVFITKVDLPVSTISLKTTPQYALITSFIFIVLFTALIVLGVYLGRFYMAEVLYNKGVSQNYEGRLQYFSKALTYNSYRSQFYLSLADSFLGRAQEVSTQGGNSAAISQFLASAVNAAKQATDISPNNVANWEFLARMYANAKPIAPEADSWVLTSLEKAIQLEKNNPLLYINLGSAKLSDKRYGEAKEDFEKALNLKPNLLIGYLQLATLNEAQNNMDGAVAALERGLNYGSNNAEYLVNLGRIYINRGTKNDYGLAELAFKKALVLNPNYSDALFGLAYLYEKQGFKTQATELYKKVLELNPNNENLIEKINDLTGPPPVVVMPTSTLPTAPNKKK